MDEPTTKRVLCDHLPCRCYVEKEKAIVWGGGTYCDKNCAQHPLTGNKCVCGHPDC